MNGKPQTQVATPVHEDEGFGPATPADLLSKGKTLQKVGTPFVTAISVQKPRDLDKIVAAIDREAQYAGDSFYYAWTDKKGNRIEGPSIGLANSLAREWTNCGVTVDFQETEEVFVITPRFIDIEKGFQCERVYRQRKNAVQGNFDPDRKLDMALQIGQSKAIRNVVVNAVPRWLVERGIEKAKEAVLKGINPKELEKYKEILIREFGAFKVTPEQMTVKAAKPLAEWTVRDIADFKGDLKALKNGEVTVAELFPPKDAQREVEGPISGKVLADALIPDEPAKEPLITVDPDHGGGPSAEEQERIRLKDIAGSKAFQCATCGLFGSDKAEDVQAHQAKEHPPTKKANGAPPSKGGIFG